MNVTIEGLVAVGTAVVGIIVWLVRLEAKVKACSVKAAQNKAEHESCKHDVAESFQRATDKLDELLQNVSHMKGRLDAWFEKNGGSE